MKKTKTKCYLYTRVSTSMQVDGYSLDAQRDKLRKYAEYEDMVVAGEYSDEGFSGKNIQGRHEFQRMLQDIQDLSLIHISFPAECHGQPYPLSVPVCTAAHCSGSAFCFSCAWSKVDWRNSVSA